MTQYTSTRINSLSHEIPWDRNIYLFIYFQTSHKFVWKYYGSIIFDYIQEKKYYTIFIQFMLVFE